MMPTLHECVVGKVGNPRTAPDAALQKAREQCGAQYVRPCVMREEIKQSAGTPAPAAPKEDAATAQSRYLHPAHFRRSAAHHRRHHRAFSTAKSRTRPRSPSVKPTPTRRRRPMRPTAKLAHFYYDRGSCARAACPQQGCARRRLASARGRQGGDRVKLISRIRQFVALQYRAIGDPKQAIADLQTDRAGRPTSPACGALDQRAAQHRGDAGFHGRRHPGEHLRGPHRSALQEARGSPQSELARGLRASTAIPGKPTTIRA